jgi:hypothetical protein
VFHMDVAKVDLDVAYVALLYTYVSRFCSQCFIYFFRRMLQMCLSECCIWFTHIFASVLSAYLQVFFRRMLQMVSSVFEVFLQVFQMHVPSVSSVFT